MEDGIYGYCNKSPASKIDPSGLLTLNPLTPIINRRRSDCIYESIYDNCGLLVPGRWTPLSHGKPTHIFVIIACIVQGEGGWNPGQRTTITDGPYAHQHACGPFQIVDQADDGYCYSKGYPNWKSKTDSCDNLKCGVAKLCDCLNAPNNTNHEIHFSDPYHGNPPCTTLYNAIYLPTGTFDKCVARESKKKRRWV